MLAGPNIATAAVTRGVVLPANTPSDRRSFRLSVHRSTRQCVSTSHLLKGDMTAVAAHL